MSSKTDAFGSRSTINVGGREIGIYQLSKLQEKGLGDITALPYSIRVLLESVLRNCDGRVVTEEDVKNLAAYDAASPAKVEIPFKPSRVVLQDFTGVPPSLTSPRCDQRWPDLVEIQKRLTL